MLLVEVAYELDPRRPSDSAWLSRAPSLVLSSWTTVDSVHVSQPTVSASSRSLVLIDEICHLLHVSLLGADAPSTLLRQHCQRLLSHVVHALAWRPYDLHHMSGSFDMYREFLLWLASHSGRPLWRRQVISASTPDPHSSDQVRDVVLNLVEMTSLHFQHHQGEEIGDQGRFEASPNEVFCHKWAELALDWAVQCIDLAAATRSWQIFRTLWAQLSSDAITTQCLQATVSRLGLDTVVPLLCEMLATLQVVCLFAPVTVLLAHPKLVWHTINLLHSTDAAVCVYALRLLHTVLPRLPLGDPAVQSNMWAHSSHGGHAGPCGNGAMLMAATTVAAIAAPLLPAARAIPFSPLQPLVFRGLEHAATRDAASSFLPLLLELPWPDLVDPSPTAFVRNVVAQLPYLAIQLRGMTVSPSVTLPTPVVGPVKPSPVFPVPVQNMVRRLEAVLVYHQQPGLALVLRRYLRGDFDCVWLFFQAIKLPLLAWIARYHGLSLILCQDLTDRLYEGSSRYQHVLLMLLQVLADHAIAAEDALPKSLIESLGALLHMPREIAVMGWGSSRYTTASTAPGDGLRVERQLNSSPTLARQASLVLQTLWKHSVVSAEIVEPPVFLPRWLYCPRSSDAVVIAAVADDPCELVFDGCIDVSFCSSHDDEKADDSSDDEEAENADVDDGDGDEDENEDETKRGKRIQSGAAAAVQVERRTAEAVDHSFRDAALRVSVTPSQLPGSVAKFGVRTLMRRMSTDED
jgi:hypothetical protein